MVVVQRTAMKTIHKTAVITHRARKKTSQHHAGAQRHQQEAGVAAQPHHPAAAAAPQAARAGARPPAAAPAGATPAKTATRPAVAAAVAGAARRRRAAARPQAAARAPAGAGLCPNAVTIAKTLAKRTCQVATTIEGTHSLREDAASRRQPREGAGRLRRLRAARLRAAARRRVAIRVYRRTMTAKAVARGHPRHHVMPEGPVSHPGAMQAQAADGDRSSRSGSWYWAFWTPLYSTTFRHCVHVAVLLTAECWL